ncbi:MAG: hypothetical protein AB7O38_21970 [Pirellulaceae bacterium]
MRRRRTHTRRKMYPNQGSLFQVPIARLDWYELPVPLQQRLTELLGQLLSDHVVNDAPRGEEREVVDE